MTKAVFLDRDGVINRNVFYPDTASYESPRRAIDFELFADTVAALRSLQTAGYALLLVSNQPNVAKCKSSLVELQDIQAKFRTILDQEQIHFLDFYYCFHHPDSTVPFYGGICNCRKPSPYFLQKAATDYSIDLAASWMIGDRLSDIECGNRGGARTIFVARNPDNLPAFPALLRPDFIADSLNSATHQILSAVEDTYMIR